MKSFVWKENQPFFLCIITSSALAIYYIQRHSGHNDNFFGSYRFNKMKFIMAIEQKKTWWKGLAGWVWGAKFSIYGHRYWRSWQIIWKKKDKERICSRHVFFFLNSLPICYTAKALNEPCVFMSVGDALHGSLTQCQYICHKYGADLKWLLPYPKLLLGAHSGCNAIPHTHTHAWLAHTYIYRCSQQPASSI